MPIRTKRHAPNPTHRAHPFHTIYDAAGKLIEEYSTIVAFTNDAEVAYLTNDHLGSPRINTDANGAITARHDYHPFGEEIETSHRTSGINYVGDTVRKQFTGYERDGEVDLDFAQARYFASNYGRFSSPDEPFAGQSEDDPQTWNLFTYTSNNPITRVDPTGRRWFYRTVENTLEIQWVNPNDDGSFTSPTGDGWIMQSPEATLVLYSAEEDKTYYLSEIDGRPEIHGIKTNRGVEDVSLETFAGFRLAKGSGSALKGIYNGARTLWAAYLARKAEKKLIKELAELTTDELTDRLGSNGAEMLRDVFGREFGAINVRGAEASRIARDLLRMGVKKIPDGLTREQLLVYRQIAVNAIKSGIDKGAQADRLKTIDYLLTKLKN